MRIKRFEAPDNQTALRMVKEALGDEALILATRTLSPTERKNAGDVRVEVVAAVDFNPETLPDHTDLEVAEPSPKEYDSYDYSVVRRPAPDIQPASSDTASQVQPSQSQMTFPSGWHKAKSSPAPQPERSALPPNSVTGQDHEPIARSRKERPNPEALARWREQLIDQITIHPPQIKVKGNEPAIIALVGATGVGKTTTAAKLAAWYSLREGRKVTLLSMDCYRIGATDQLRTYAKIMRLPCEIALRKTDLQKSIEKHLQQDVIIIDTAGKSPYQETHITELADWFGGGYPVMPYLVLSATTKKEDMAHILKTYEPLPPAGIMITKLDETRAYAALCQQLAHSSLPVASFSFGQKVPEDFMLASKDFLATLFKEGWSAAATEAGAA